MTLILATLVSFPPFAFHKDNEFDDTIGKVITQTGLDDKGEQARSALILMPFIVLINFISFFFQERSDQHFLGNENRILPSRKNLEKSEMGKPIEHKKCRGKNSPSAANFHLRRVKWMLIWDAGLVRPGESRIEVQEVFPPLQHQQGE